MERGTFASPRAEVDRPLGRADSLVRSAVVFRGTRRVRHGRRSRIPDASCVSMSPLLTIRPCPRSQRAYRRPGRYLARLAPADAVGGLLTDLPDAAEREDWIPVFPDARRTPHVRSGA